LDSVFNGIEKVVGRNGIDLNLFKQYLSEKTAKRIGYTFIDSIVKKDDFVPHFNVHVSTRTVLINSDRIYLELELLAPGHQKNVFVSNNNCSQAVGVLKGEAKLRRFSAPVAPANHIEATSADTLRSGDAQAFTNEYYLVDNNSSAPLLLLYITDRKSLSRGATVSAYRADTGKFSHLVSGSLSSSRLEMMIWVMGEMKYQGCSELVKSLSYDHADYFVRWEAIRAYVKLNPSQAVTFLSSILESEKHPHVVNAARASLELVKRSYQGG
jgi:hypothetical protein